MPRHKRPGGAEAAMTMVLTMVTNLEDWERHGATPVTGRGGPAAEPACCGPG